MVPAAIVIQYFHIESFCSSRDCASYPAETDYAKSRAVHIVAKHQIRRPTDFPFICPDIPVRIDDATCARKNERKCKVCCCLSQNVCSIGDIDPPRCGLLNIDVLKARAVRADNS